MLVVSQTWATFFLAEHLLNRYDTFLLLGFLIYPPLPEKKPFWNLRLQIKSIHSAVDFTLLAKMGINEQISRAACTYAWNQDCEGVHNNESTLSLTLQPSRSSTVGNMLNTVYTFYSNG